MAEKELGWKRGWFVGLNLVLRCYQRSMWKIAVVGQPEVMMSVWSGLQLSRILLIVFQRARGLDEDDWTSEA